MYHSLIYDEQIGRHFHNYCADKLNFTFKELLAFFRDEQKDIRANDPAYVSNLVWDFVTSPGRDPRQPSLSLHEVHTHTQTCTVHDYCVCVYCD